MFLAKNRLKLVKNNTFFIVILLGYGYFIEVVYIRVGNIIDLLIDIIIKYPLFYFSIGDWWCMGGVYNVMYFYDINFTW